MYCLKIVSLDGCPYSKAGEELLEKYNPKVIHVSRDEKENYKTNEISTFPQIYFNTGHQELLIGGYSDTKDLFDKLDKLNTKNINVAVNLMKQYNWDINDKKRFLINCLK